MKRVVLWGGIAGLLLVGGANAQSGAELAKSKNCMNCHDLEKKYKDNKDAEATIVGKLKDGKGHPVKVAASEGELKAMTAYALAGK
jgi:cytochrome c551/c552